MAVSGREALSLPPVAAAVGVGGGRSWSSLWLPRMVSQPLTVKKTHIFCFRRAQLIRRRTRRQSWRCEIGPEPDASSPEPEKEVLEEATGTGSIKDSPSFMEGPTKETNRVIALTSTVAAIGFFFFTRAGLSGATLGELAASAIPYEEALSNGKPTVVEFYADWCEVCREMAPDVYKVEQQYKGQVNFVMLNVDNNKWDEELDEFGVEGIPHFAFLDMKGNEEGNVVGRLPKKYLEDNVVALAKGGGKIPHTRVVGQFSSAESRQTSKVGEPMSHGI